MSFSQSFLSRMAALTSLVLPLVSAGFDPSSKTNIAVYWGQNSYGQATSQERLSYYCSNTEIDIIPIAFLLAIDTPTINVANAGNNCTTFAGTELLDCPQIEADIEECQSSYNKTIMLSIGGATYTEGGFTSSTAAIAAAQEIWAMFGPVQASSTVDRPFGDAVVDGFDFDFESVTENTAYFAAELRALMNAATAAGDKEYYLSAAPQCPYPDAADNDMLDGAVSFDFIMIQFYNNYCSISTFVAGDTAQPYFDYTTWDAWAQTVSANPNVKILVGIPANTGAGSGYTTGATLEAALQYSETFSSFGGVMMWDMSQLYANTGFLDEVAADLGSGGGSPTPTSTSKTSTTTSTTLRTSTTASATTTTLTRTSSTTLSSSSSSSSASASSTGAPVAEWGQCGGIGYTGSTVCASPYSCVCNSVWWCQCE
ncbi:glycoside hydrolase family 18 protein [Coniella lustricola]|uniref:chitinase n=1 Tax=Coniella lustricola TaxID=2025994 RepID=A0A2T3A0Q9_9PEZI|nr:glycoside hydrolase family 18 protein [Coniella lustricola]